MNLKERKGAEVENLIDRYLKAKNSALKEENNTLERKITTLWEIFAYQFFIHKTIVDILMNAVSALCQPLLSLQTCSLVEEVLLACVTSFS